eukprot:c47114_g1_i1 orf=404-1162(-)
MLAVFHKSVADGPEELCIPCVTPDCTENGAKLLNAFVSDTPETIHATFKSGGGMAYTHNKQALLAPRSFASVDGIFCLFEGNLQNLPVLRQEYGLAKNVSEVMLVIEAYRALRDRGPYPADQVVGSLTGQFIFILFDTNNRSLFVAADTEGKLPLFWGMTKDGGLAFSNKSEVLKKGCGMSFAPFPTGCYFSSKNGLQSYEHPLQQLKPVPRVGSHGQALAAAFKVDMTKRDLTKQGSMHRVGSEANWATSI